MKKALLGALLVLTTATASHAGFLGKDWQETQVRIGIEGAEVIWPVFGEEAAVNSRFAVVAGLSWRPIHEEGSLGDWGLWAGGSIYVDDEPFNWIEFGGGVHYREGLHVGQLLRIGNKTVEENGVLSVMPGVGLSMKTVVGIGVSADPE